MRREVVERGERKSEKWYHKVTKKEVTTCVAFECTPEPEEAMQELGNCPKGEGVVVVVVDGRQVLPAANGFRHWREWLQYVR